jgi:DNA-binding XRE family transcriptional regulator
MDNKIKNELFFVACDYLYKEKLVTSQKDLAQKIGISEASFSRIKKGRVVSDETLRKLNESFGSIFNMQFNSI